MKIIIGNDHGAVELKERLIEFLEKEGHQIINMGVNSTDSVDYPDIAEAVCQRFLQEQENFDFGILACGTGIGISISANKVNGIRAALPQNSYAAAMAKEHNNANFIVFGGRIEYSEPIEVMLKAYMNADFGGDRHQRRIDKMMKIETKE